MDMDLRLGARRAGRVRTMPGSAKVCAKYALHDEYFTCIPVGAAEKIVALQVIMHWLNLRADCT